MKVDDTVEQREDLGRESSHISHGPMMGICDGEEVVHPASVDETPGHERQEWYLHFGVNP